jgi:hypothetical protein
VGLILLKPGLWALSDGPYEAELISTQVKAQRLRALLESWFAQTEAKCTLDSSKIKVCLNSNHSNFPNLLLGRYIVYSHNND